MPNRPLKKPKRGRGRPTDFRPEYCAIARGFYENGATDAQVADVLRVDVSTVRRWRVQYNDFREALKLGKEAADAIMEHTLYQRGVGYAYDTMKVEFKRLVKTHPNGMVEETYEPMTYTYREQALPDVGAIKHWLVNRQPDKWREKVDHGVTIDPNSPFERMLATFDGESRGLPPGNEKNNMP